MDFSIIDPHTNAVFQQILSRIRRLQSGGTIDSLQDIGANTDHQIGASYVSLKELAATYPPDEKLALLLWNQGQREEQIVAWYNGVYDRYKYPVITRHHVPVEWRFDLNKEKITQLAPHCLHFEIAGYLGSLYLYKRSDLLELSEEWLNSENPFMQLAIMTALARYLILNKESDKISKDYFRTVVNRNYKDKYVQLAAERYRFNI